jgi:hypothetical protein
VAYRKRGKVSRKKKNISQKIVKFIARNLR